tara:strand:- start:85 stop:291 length:207 start_codon:yes stop_codon:yes gene_type:complete
LAQIATLKTSLASLESEKDRTLEELSSTTQKIAELEAESIAKAEDHTSAIDNHSSEAKNLRQNIEDAN